MNQLDITMECCYGLDKHACSQGDVFCINQSHYSLVKHTKVMFVRRFLCVVVSWYMTTGWQSHYSLVKHTWRPESV